MRKVNAFLLLCLALLLVSVAMPGQAEGSNAIALTSSGWGLLSRESSSGGIVPICSAGKAASMLQFQAGVHILGFQPNRVYLAGLDHALSVEFLGTQGTMPTSVAGSATRNNSRKAAPLATVVYRNLWEGIDLTYAAAHDGIAESTYHLAPGSDVSGIRLRYNVPVELQGDGSLRYSFAGGYLTESPPVAWQEIEGHRVPVEAGFRVSGHEVGFVLGPYDRAQPLIIDPTYAWHAFYGASGFDTATGIALDGDGNIYVTGWSSATWGTPLHQYSGGSSDIVVLKLNSSGVYQWHTFYGGTGTDAGYKIAVDGNKNIHVTGWSDATWGTPGHEHSVGINPDIVVLKLDPNGGLLWNTFCGSTGDDYGYDIAVNGSGDLYVTGGSNATWNFESSAPVQSHSGGADIVVLKVTSSGAYQWHTFHGSGTNDLGLGIALRGEDVFVTGWSDATWGSPGNAHSGARDIFVLKLDGSGGYLWHTFYGGDSNDAGQGVALDGEGNIYVTGYSGSTWGSPISSHSGGLDIVVLKLNSLGERIWHTFHGSSSTDYGNAIALNGSGNIYVTGVSYGTWGSPLHAYSGTNEGDAVVLRLDTSGTCQWHTFYGSSALDDGQGVVLDSSGNIYFAGYSYGTWGSPLNAYGGGGDIFVQKLIQPEVGSVYLNEDGRADIVWRHAVAGTVHAWLMNGASIAGQGTVGNVPDLSWKIEKVADFNGDGKADILWRHAVTGTVHAWLMNGTSIAGQGTVSNVPDLSWKIEKVADFNGDGKADILWRHAVTGTVHAWLMNGASIAGQGTVSNVPDLSWQMVE